MMRRLMCRILPRSTIVASTVTFPRYTTTTVVANAATTQAKETSASSSTLNSTNTTTTVGSDDVGIKAQYLNLKPLEDMAIQQRRKEQEVDSRVVLFATGTSAENRPRAAVHEAFNIAAAALPRPANFAIVNVSLDLETMVDAPEMAWGLLKRAGGDKVKMIGTAVNMQRFLHGGFVQIILGCVPDIECEVFTLDAVPTKENLLREHVRPAVACYTTVDANLARHYEAAIINNLCSLKDALPTVPIFGTVMPLVGRAKETSSNDSLAFFDDRVFKGSAAVCILRSNLLRCKSLSVVPSIELENGIVGGVTVVDKDNGLTSIMTINGDKATDVIKRIYTTHLAQNRTSKVFIAIEHQDGTACPLTFTGNPETGELLLVVPQFADIKDGDTAHFVCDDVDLDSEYIAGSLLKVIEDIKPVFVEKSIRVAREGTKFVVASSCAGVHFSQGFMNQIATKDDVISVGGSGESLFVPPIITRCIGRQAATGGFYSPAQIIEINGRPMMVARSATATLLYGTT